jgi:hypothetical protein
MADMFGKLSSWMLYVLMFSFVEVSTVFAILTPAMLTLSFQSILNAAFVPLITVGIFFEPIILLRKVLRGSQNVVIYDSGMGKSVYYKNFKGVFVMLLDSLLFSMEWTFGMILLVAGIVNFILGYYSVLFCALIIIGSGLNYALNSKNVRINTAIFAIGISLLVSWMVTTFLFSGAPAIMNVVISMATLAIFALKILSAIED